MFVGICFVFGALSGLRLANGANKNESQSVPDECKGLNFCTVKPDDYPQELFNEMFRGKFTEPVFQPTSVISEGRLGDPDINDDCDSIVTFEPLYKVRPKGGNWETVVQAPEENYLQMVRLETCDNEGSACFTEFSAPVGLQTLCKQKYNVWEFLVHDGDSGTKKVKVDLPICCSCHYKSDF